MAKPKLFDKAATASKLGLKTKSSGFAAGGSARKAGGSVPGEGDEPMKRARGGRTSAPFSAGQTNTSRGGKSSSGHECE